jgi:hypothetical protein
MTRPSPSLTAFALDRSVLLSTPLEQFAGLAFVAHCGDPACPAPRSIPVADVMAARGNAALADVLGSFRCTACSSEARSVSLQQKCYGGWIIQPVLTPDQVPTLQ